MDLVAIRRHPALHELLGYTVDPLALKEDDRVCTDQGRVHQALGIIGCGREHDLQAGDVCAQAGPVLAVLGPYLLPTETRTVTGILSSPPLMDCHLESWLKTSSPAVQEVAVHQLHQGATALQGIADALPTMAPSEIGELKSR